MDREKRTIVRLQKEIDRVGLEVNVDEVS